MMLQEACTRSSLRVTISQGQRLAIDPQRSGGDFFTTVRHVDGTVSFAIGDLSAKGPAGEEQAHCLCEAARIAMALTRRARPILEFVSEAFHQHIAPQGNEFTAFVAAGTLDPENALLHYAAAGGEAAIVVRNPSNHEHLGPTGPLIGLSSASRFDEVTVPFESGSALLLFTDGVLESRDSEGYLLGTSGLMHLIRRSVMRQLVPSSRRLLCEIDRYCSGAYRDDATLAIVLAL
jgi:sigma-B regulation protein RsbU (phosphoserine phosphatase)